MIVFQCACGRRLQEPERASGAEAVCPDCERVVAVPSLALAAAPARPAWGDLTTAPEVAPAGRGKAIAVVVLAVAAVVLAVPAWFVGRQAVGRGSRDWSQGKPVPKEAGPLGGSGTGKLVPVGTNVWLEIDGDVRRVVVQAEVCKREGPLEQLMTRKGAKEHEAILAADVDARKIHEALTLAGAKPGSTVSHLPRFRAPTGTTVRVFVRYQEDGRTKTVNARSWVRETNKKEELPCDWVFAGSDLVENPFDPKAPKQYLANEGDVICVTNFEGALLDVPIASSKGDALRGFEAWTERIPPVPDDPDQRVKVTVVLEPVR